MMLMQKLKSDLAIAMRQEMNFRKDGISSGEEYEKAIAHKDVSRAIISMTPQLGKKPNDVTDEEVLKLLSRYIAQEKERTLYQQGFLKQEDVEGKSSQEVKKLVGNKIKVLGDQVTSTVIEVAQEYLPKQPKQEEILEFIKTIDFSQFKNKMQAMKLIMQEFPGLDGNIAKQVLISYES